MIFIDLEASSLSSSRGLSSWTSSGPRSAARRMQPLLRPTRAPHASTVRSRELTNPQLDDGTRPALTRQASHPGAPFPRRRSRKVTWCRRLSWEGWVEEDSVQDPAPRRQSADTGTRQARRPEAPAVPKQVWAIRARLELSGNLRDLVLFNLAIDSKPRGCGLVRLKVAELIVDERVRSVSPSSRARPSGRCSSRSPRTSATRSGSGSRGPRGVPFGSAPPVGRARPVSQDICPSIWYHFLIKR